MTLSASPHVNSAARSGLPVLLIGLMFAMIGFLLASAAENNFTAAWKPDIYVPSAVGYLAASLFVAAAGLVAAGMVVHGRLHAIAAVERFGETAPDDAELPRFWFTPGWLAGWPQVLASVLLGAAAMAAVIAAWHADDQRMLSPQIQQVYGGLLILLAFPLLVLERVYANTAPQMLPDAPQIERLLRVPLVTFVGFGITSVLLSVGFQWPSMVERTIAIVIGLVGAGACPARRRDRLRAVRADRHAAFARRQHCCEPPSPDAAELHHCRHGGSTPVRHRPVAQLGLGVRPPGDGADRLGHGCLRVVHDRRDGAGPQRAGGL